MQMEVSLDPNRRIKTVDQLRGFALFGIFLVNSLMFQYGIYGYDAAFYELGPADQVVFQLIEYLFQGSFYPIFSILFGFGAVVMYEKASANGRSFYWPYARRLLILLIIGLLHLYFIWDGDILSTYAMVGALFMLFIHPKVKVLLFWISFLFILNLAPFLMTADFNDTSGIPAFSERFIEKEAEVLSTGTYGEIVTFRLTADPFEDEGLLGYTVAIISSLFTFLQILMLFLVGAVLAKVKWLHDPRKFAGRLKVLAITGLLIGFSLKLGMIIGTNAFLYQIGYMVGGPILGIGYLATFALFTRSEPLNKLTTGLQSVGKLALTNYLMQSIIMTTLFYGYGLGQFGSLGTLIGMLIVLFVFLLQMIFSTLYLRKFKMGPAEYIWRKGIYLGKN